jgi:hypothetical protein
MITRFRIRSTALAGILLLCAAVIIIILQQNEKTAEHYPNPQSSTYFKQPKVKDSKPKSDKDGNKPIGDSEKSRPIPVVKISGIDELPYKSLVKQMNLNDILHKCGLLTDGEYEIRNSTGTKTIVDIYFDEKGEIVHMSHGKGLYQTHSLDREAMASFDRNDMPGGGGLRIVEFGIPGLTLSNVLLLRPFLAKSAIKSGDNWGRMDNEIELTPVIVEVTENFQGDPKYIGRRFPMLLEKTASGILSDTEHRVTFPEFQSNQIVRRKWRLEPFLPDTEDAGGRTPRIGGGGPFDEPLLDAWNAKYGAGNKPETGERE